MSCGYPLVYYELTLVNLYTGRLPLDWCAIWCLTTCSPCFSAKSVVRVKKISKKKLVRAPERTLGVRGPHSKVPRGALSYCALMF